MSVNWFVNRKKNDWLTVYNRGLTNGMIDDIIIPIIQIGFI